MALHEQTNNAFFRQLAFLVLLIVLGLVILTQLRFFLGAFLGAFTLYVVSRKWLFGMIDRHGVRPWVAALAIVLSATVILGGVGYLMFEVTARQIPTVDTSRIVAYMTGLVDHVNETVGFQALSSNLLGEYSSVLQRVASAILNTTYSFAVNVFLMLVILFFMLANARKLEAQILAYQPFRGDSLQMIEHEVRQMVWGNAVGIPVIMFAQGVVAWIVYTIYGFENAVFWAFLTALAGLIPMIGTTLVSAPMGIVLIAGGDTAGGVLLIALGLLVIANVDNLVRIVLLNKVANTHPLTVIFGVILGIPLFGFWGIIFGPLLISGVFLLVRIYYREYGLISLRTLRRIEHEGQPPQHNHDKPQ